MIAWGGAVTAELALHVRRADLHYSGSSSVVGLC